MGDKGLLTLGGLLTGLAVGLARYMYFLDPAHEWLTTWATVIVVVYLAWLGWYLLFVVGLQPLGAQWKAATDRGAADPAAETTTRPIDGVEVKAKMNDARGKVIDWNDLPVVPVPTSGGDLRLAVLRFAQEHGFRPFEHELGFLVTSAQGQTYRVAPMVG